MTNQKWNREKINEAFYDKINDLRKIPTQKEMPGSLMNAIWTGRYNNIIKTYNQFLEYHGFESNRKSWPRERINEAFYDKINELRRIPMIKELPRGLFNAISKQNYHPEIINYHQFLEHHGFEINMGKWTRENINKTFYDTMNKLRRIPMIKELPRGLFNAISKQNYHPEIINYHQFLEHHGFETDRRRLTRVKINEMFYDKINKLRRVPTQEELGNGLASAIKRGRYDPNISTYNQFLEHHGFELNKKNWTKEKINEMFYDKVNELRRIPRAKEVNGGSLRLITNGMYDPKIKSWNQFLEYHGFKPNGYRKSILEILLRDKK